MVIGVVGTAKNTGKTTTLSYLMHHARKQGVRVGVTGIGYDGEEIDTITFLPKPRLYLSKGTIVTTSEGCLRNSSAQWNIRERTGMRTALGEVLILEITQPGLIVVAGPNRRTSLAHAVERMMALGVDLLLVDGSLNRIAPMSIVDSVVFTTGASRNVDCRVLAEEMKIVERMFSYPSGPSPVLAPPHITISGNGGAATVPISSLLDVQDVEAVAQKISAETKSVSIPGLVSTFALTRLLTRLEGRKIEIILADPFTFLLSAEPLELTSILSSIEKSSCTVSYSRKPRLAAITINPFYPKPTGTNFASAFIDKEAMMTAMRAALSSPLFNVKENDSPDLYSLCLRS